MQITTFPLGFLYCRYLAKWRRLELKPTNFIHLTSSSNILLISLCCCYLLSSFLFPMDLSFKKKLFFYCHISGFWGPLCLPEVIELPFQWSLWLKINYVVYSQGIHWKLPHINHFNFTQLCLLYNKNSIWYNTKSALGLSRKDLMQTLGQSWEYW